MPDYGTDGTSTKIHDDFSIYYEYTNSTEHKPLVMNIICYSFDSYIIIFFVIWKFKYGTLRIIISK